MAAEQLHLAQAEYNKQCLNDLCLTYSYLDWIVTVLYYYAIHKTEAFLATINIHSSDHGDRIRTMVRMPNARHKKRGRMLIKLRSQSEWARYIDAGKGKGKSKCFRDCTNEHDVRNWVANTTVLFSRI